MRRTSTRITQTPETDASKRTVKSANDTSPIPTLLAQLLDAPAPLAAAAVDGTIRAVNQAWCEVFGKPSEAFVDVPLTALVDGDPTDLLTRCCEATGEPGTQPVQTVEVCISGMGTARVCISIARTRGPGTDLLLLSARRVGGSTGVDADTHLLAAALDHAGAAILIKNLDAVVTCWNREAEALYGYSAGEALGKSIRQLHGSDLSDDQWREVVQRVRSGSASSRRAQRRRKNGDIVTVDICNTPLFDTEGRLCAELTIARDVTELDRIERSLTAAESDLSERLAQLEATNAALEREVQERREMESVLHATNTELKETVNDLKWFNHESDVFSEMAEILQACRNFDESFAAISEYGQKLLPDAAGHFFVFRDSRDALEHAACWGEDAPREPMMAPDACWALRRGQVHHVTHRSRLRCSHIDHAAAGSICVPIVGQGQTLGLLQIAAYHEEWDNPKQGEITLRRLRTMADRVGPALANLKLRETLRTLSIRDPLTGLFNRRYLEESLARELHRAARSNRPLAAIMIDIDHFKRFNDEFGHDAGDLVLRTFAELILEHIRKSDMACRLGGEELVVVLPDAGLEVAVARAEALRAAIHGLSLRYQDKPLGTVTASFGVAVYPEHGVNAEALLHAGDCALYRAKREGRNRVCIASAV